MLLLRFLVVLGGLDPSHMEMVFLSQQRQVRLETRFTVPPTELDKHGLASA